MHNSPIDVYITVCCFMGDIFGEDNAFLAYLVLLIDRIRVILYPEDTMQLLLFVPKLIFLLMKFPYSIISSLFAILMLLSCGEDRTYQYLELTEEAQWIYSQMKENYLWSDSIKKPARKEFFSTASKFYASLLYKEDNVSYFTDSASMTSYGMSFMLMRDPLEVERNRYYALVLFVEPGSPADDAGLKRGTWIYKADNNALSVNKQNLLLSGNGITLSTRYIEQDDETMEYKWMDGDTLLLSAAEDLQQDALFMDSLYNVRGRQIGYVICNSFDDDNLVTEIAAAFDKFRLSGVEDLIIDLRYNNGGSLACAAKVASMLVPADKAGSSFGHIEYNSNNADKKKEYYFEQVASTLETEKIYVLMTEQTSGTAEAFIAALRGALGNEKVVLMGATTAGKNLYVSSIESPYGYTINPAVAYLCSANGTMLSSYGIFCDYAVDELAQPTAIYQLGELQEYMLYCTTYLISNGSLPITN